MSVELDQDVLLACVELAGRTGAKSFEIGWLNDPGEPAYDARGPQWWAKCQYRGERIIEADHPGPNEVCTALAQRILKGAKCKCGKLVALSPFGAVAYRVQRMADGSTWTAEEAAAAGQCQWLRVGPHWKRGCE